jgi:YVTN family beta-propeller protein
MYWKRRHSDPSAPGLTLIATIVCLVVGCTAFEPAQTSPPGARIYVANESSNNVTVINAADYRVIATVDARSQSTHDLSLTRDGKWLFATNLGSGNLSVIDTTRLEMVASIPTGARCHVVTLTNDNRQAWVANIAEDNVSIVDTASFQILGTIRVGRGPTGLAFSRDGRFAHVANQGDKTVVVVDTSTHAVIKTIRVGNNPHFLILGPDGRIWGSNTGDSDIYVIDPAIQEKIATIDVGPAPQQIAFGYKGLQGPNAYVTLAGLNKVLVIVGDPRSPRFLERIDVGDRPNGIWANPEGTRVYVVHESSNDLRVIDTGSSQVIATVPVGRKPIRVVVSR